MMFRAIAATPMMYVRMSMWTYSLGMKRGSWEATRSTSSVR